MVPKDAGNGAIVGVTNSSSSSSAVKSRVWATGGMRTPRRACTMPSRGLRHAFGAVAIGRDTFSAGNVA